MSTWLARTLILLVSIMSITTQAHDVPASNVLLDIGAHAITAEIQLPISELSAAMGLPRESTSTQLIAQYGVQISAYINQHIGIATADGKLFTKRSALLEARPIRDGDWIIAHVDFTAPREEPTKIFTLHYDVIVADVITHNVLVSVRRDFRNGLFGNSEHGDDALMIGLMHYQQKQLTVDGSDGSWWRGFGKVFQLGIQHIAEGTDHVLFLLALLLSAPLSVRNRRWQNAVSMKASAWKVLKIVSGFTLGHSLTLVLGAIGIVRFPAQPIEALIALSILVSAAHAIRPLFANKEHVVAALFGLVHGMAFAGSLSSFNYDSLTLTFAVLGFNLGIEVMQLAIVALVLPSLLVMRASPLYRYVRIGAAIATGILATGWMLERAFAITNPLSGVSVMLAAHAALAIGILAAVAIAARANDVLRCCDRLVSDKRITANRHFAANRCSQINLRDPFTP